MSYVPQAKKVTADNIQVYTVEGKVVLNDTDDNNMIVLENNQLRVLFSYLKHHLMGDLNVL